MNNRYFFYKFANQMREEHFEFYDIIFSNGYFLFEGDEDSVIQFKIKGLDNWLFGVWIKEDEKDKKYLDVFCQHEMFIDKFKPSRGDFDIKVRYYEDDGTVQQDFKFDTFELENALEFMKEHEAIFFWRGDDPYRYIPEWKAKLEMAKTILQEKSYQKGAEKTYRLIQNTIKLAYKLKIFQTMYDKDSLNEEFCHINDVYYIYASNIFAKIIVKYLQHKKRKFFDLGYICVYDNKAVWMAEYNRMRYDRAPLTTEEIVAECSDIKEKQKTEYKAQYDRLIKYVWED